MRPARKTEFGQHLSQDLQNGGLFFVYGGKPDDATAVPTDGFHSIEALEFGDDASRGQLEAILAGLTFQQAVSQQGKHVDEEHGLDTLVLVQTD